MAIPLPMRSIDISLVRFTVQTVNTSTGALTDSATVATLTAQLASFSVRNTMTLSRAKAITSTRRNSTPLDTGWTVTVAEYMDRRPSVLPSTGAILSKLAALVADPANSPFVKCEFTRGNGSGNTETIYLCYQDFTEGPYEDDVVRSEMSFAECDNGASTYAYA